jgi:hypothetical protein
MSDLSLSFTANKFFDSLRRPINAWQAPTRRPDDGSLAQDEWW